MNLAAAHDLGDIGKMDYCNSLAGANYGISSFNVTTLPIIIRFGLCLPEECRQTDFDKAGIAITDSVAPVFMGLLHSMCPGCFPKQVNF